MTIILDRPHEGWTGKEGRSIMSSNDHLKASEVRARVHHPVIDADGHWLEFGPTVCEQLRRIGGDRAVEGFTTFRSLIVRELKMSVADRRDRRTAQQAFWGIPAKNYPRPGNGNDATADV
jgi:hypothetical protein